MNRRQRQRKLRKWKRKYPKRYSRFEYNMMRKHIKISYKKWLAMITSDMFNENNVILSRIKCIDQFVGKPIAVPILYGDK